jgi:membrane associated rhomboid family serine protease
MATCYRHPSRETGVSCSNCGRPICPDCMTPTAVGMRCPECAKQRTKVRSMRTMSGSGLEVTRALIAINVLAFLISGHFTLGGGGSGGEEIFRKLALYGPAIGHNDEYWRLISGGFLHSGFLHIAFNMYLLYLLGQLLEPALGTLKFAAVYFTALLAGSCGALLVSPDTITVGASGAVFGLMGAAAVEMRARGINPMQTNIGGLIVINLAFSFAFSGISVGGHIGGLIGGALAALAIQLGDRRRSLLVALAVCAAVAVGAVAGSVAASRSSGPDALNVPAQPAGLPQ